MSEFWQGFLWGIGTLAAFEAAAVFAFYKVMNKARITG